MADQPITTSIDDLVKYLSQHGETDSTTLSQALNVSEGIVETWVDVLEKASIVKISYKLGKMFISPNVLTREGAEAAKKSVELKQTVAATELATQVQMINQLNTKLDEFKRYVSGAETAFATKAGEIKATIDQIDKLNLQVDAAYKKLKDKKDFMDQLSHRLDEETQKLEEKARNAQAVNTQDNEVKARSQDIKARLDDAENRLKSLNQSFTGAVEDNRKGFAELLTGIKSEMKGLKESLSEYDRETRDYSNAIESYKRDSDNIKRQVASEKARMLDDIARSSDEVRRVYTVAETQLGTVKKELLDMKGQFGGFADLNDKLNGIKNSIDSISKQKDEVQKDLMEMQEQLKALQALDESKIAEKSVMMRQIDGRIQETDKKFSKLNKDADGVKKGIDSMAR